MEINGNFPVFQVKTRAMTTKSIYKVSEIYFFWMNVQKVERLTPVTLIAGYA
jgi:hypothetical protein